MDTSAPLRDSHALDVALVAARLAVDPRLGLSGTSAAERLQRVGANALREQQRRPWPVMLLAQFSDFMIIVLILAAAVSAVVGDAADALAIGVIIVLNALIGFSQEWRAENALHALRRMAAARATVRRDGALLVVDAADLVPGDVVLLESGNIVPADLRLFEVAALRTDESALTGESTTVEKSVAPMAIADTPVAERINLAYKGTTVAQGRGRGIVIATGMATELGLVAALLGEDLRQRTPLQQRLDLFGRRVALVVLALCVIVFAAGLLRGEPPGLMALTAIALAVAAIPEALPAVVTILLSLGARRMVQAHALVRRLPAVETLGSVTRICADKTGTLTQNRMTVDVVYLNGEFHSDWTALAAQACGSELLRAFALNNDAVAGGISTGEPTEVALLTAAAVAGFDKTALEHRLPRVLELPFSSERKCMTTLHELPGGEFRAYTKGAPEAVLTCCDSALRAVGCGPLDAREVMSVAARLAAQGLRVLAFAYRDWPRLPRSSEPAAIESGLCFMGLVGLLDPPRPEAFEAVAQCREAGIVPIMITGDHPATAQAIAQRLHIIDDGATILTGAELASLDEAALAAIIDKVRVFARVDPTQKIKLVEALKAHGHFVAMTGDGVNDAPALMRADIGVAMGRGGTDVAREAASLILLDDNFATIIAAVKEGRRIYDNIRKFVRYAMTGNTAEILTILLAPLAGMPIPLLPIHILWVNLVTDGLPGLALAAEPAARDTMRRPPRPPRESLFAHGVWQHTIWVGVLIAGLCLLVQAWAIHEGSAHAQTMVFTVLTLSQMGHVLAIRSERDSLLRLGLMTNLPLLGAVVLTLMLQLILIYVPACHAIFGTAPLTAVEFTLCMIASAVPLVAVEAEKRWVRWS